MTPRDDAAVLATFAAAFAEVSQCETGEGRLALISSLYHERSSLVALDGR